MSNILQTRDSLASMIPMVFSMVSQITSDDTLLDEVQDKLGRILEIVKEKTVDAKPVQISTEIDKTRRERRDKERKEKKEDKKEKEKEKKEEPAVVEPVKAVRRSKKSVA